MASSRCKAMTNHFLREAFHAEELAFAIARFRDAVGRCNDKRAFANVDHRLLEEVIVDRRRRRRAVQ